MQRTRNQFGHTRIATPAKTGQIDLFFSPTVGNVRYRDLPTSHMHFGAAGYKIELQKSSPFTLELYH
jgi:hypothetical protein